MGCGRSNGVGWYVSTHSSSKQPQPSSTQPLLPSPSPHPSPSLSPPPPPTSHHTGGVASADDVTSHGPIHTVVCPTAPLTKPTRHQLELYDTPPPSSSSSPPPPRRSRGLPGATRTTPTTPSTTSTTTTDVAGILKIGDFVCHLIKGGRTPVLHAARRRGRRRVGGSNRGRTRVFR